MEETAAKRFPYVQLKLIEVLSRSSTNITDESTRSRLGLIGRQAVHEGKAGRD